MEDNELTRFLKRHAKDIPIEEVWKATKGIKGKMSDEVIKMRREED